MCYTIFTLRPQLYLSLEVIRRFPVLRSCRRLDATGSGAVRRILAVVITWLGRETHPAGGAPLGGRPSDATRQKAHAPQAQRVSWPHTTQLLATPFPPRKRTAVYPLIIGCHRPCLLFGDCPQALCSQPSSTTPSVFQKCLLKEKGYYPNVYDSTFILLRRLEA